MIDRRITIPFIFIIAAAVILAVSISDPFDIATANSGVKMIENKAEVLQESNVQAITESTLEIEESGEVFEGTKDIVELRAILIKKINATLLHPGWVKIVFERNDFTAEEDFQSFSDGVIVGNNFTDTAWMFLNGQSEFSAYYLESKLPSGEVFYNTLFSNGEKFKTEKPELLETTDFSLLMGISFLDRIIAMGTADSESERSGHGPDIKDTLSISYQIEMGRRIVVISNTSDFSYLISFNGMENKNVIQDSTRYYYDWETGLLVRSECWITFKDGTKMLATLKEVDVFHIAEVPTEILVKIEDFGE